MNEPLVVQRETQIAAPPATVFAFLTDPDKNPKLDGHGRAMAQPHSGGLISSKRRRQACPLWRRGAFFREVVPVAFASAFI